MVNIEKEKKKATFVLSVLADTEIGFCLLEITNYLKWIRQVCRKNIHCVLIILMIHALTIVISEIGYKNMQNLQGFSQFLFPLRIFCCTMLTL